MEPPFPGDRPCGPGWETRADSLALSEEPDRANTSQDVGVAGREDRLSGSTQPQLEASLWLLPPAGRARRSRNRELEVRPSVATLVTSSLSLAMAIYKWGWAFSCRAGNHMNKRLRYVQPAPHLWEAYCRMKRTVRLETRIQREHGSWAVGHTTASRYKTMAAKSGKPALYLLQ